MAQHHIIVGIITSIWIGLTAIKLFKDSYDILMDKSMNEDTKNKVYQLIKKHQEVIRINHFIIQ